MKLIFQVVYGIMRSATTCKEFISAGGLDLVIKLTRLPCIPIRMTDASDAAHALSCVFRTMNDHDPIPVVQRLIESVSHDMDSCSHLWQSETWRDSWLLLSKDEADASLWEELRRTKSMGIRLSYLTDILAGAPWHNSRSSTTLIKALGVTSGSPFIHDLGKLHRACFYSLYQHAVSAVASSSDDTSASNDTSVTEYPPPTANTETRGPTFMANHLQSLLKKFFKGWSNHINIAEYSFH